MTSSSLTLIAQRISVSRFDATHRLADADVATLVHLATRAPTAYHLQNWRFIAVRSAGAKRDLQRLAMGQAQVADAAVTYIVCGELPDATQLRARLAPCIEAGFMPPEVATTWERAASAQYVDPRAARDEALRSAAFGAATLMHAAQAMGLASGPMGGFDAAGVASRFDLRPGEIPVVLVAVGAAAPGHWPQKPRRPLDEVMEVA